MIRMTGIAVLLLALVAACSKEEPATQTTSRAESALTENDPVRQQMDERPVAPDETLAEGEATTGSGNEPMAMVPEDTELMSDEELAAMDDAGALPDDAAALKQNVTESDLAAIDAAEAMAEEVGAGPVLDQAAALKLAEVSGCLACHAMDRKVVGPAWNDVAERYRGMDGAREQLIGKVKAGGKGNWTGVTNGIPMPPYSPRVADKDIEQLVDFVLSLATE